MKRSIIKLMLLTAMAVVVAAPGGATQDYNTDSDQPIYYSDRARVDRYLDAEVWTNHADGEYYTGDDITIHFRTSRDAFVAIYSVDTRGRVNLLFPASPDDDNFVYGGETYRIPGGNWDYDLVVSGPEGIENLQIVASRDRFPIPNWYNNSGLVCDWDDRYAYMDYLNGRYFVRYDGQRFAFDRAVIFVNEWEPTYYRPIYQPYYPSWSVTGNFYIDYGWGHSVYVNGVYWGCTPLYVPRIAVGWHTVTIYDPYGYCWEQPVHISHYNTVILNRTVVNTSPTVKSKFKEVRQAGYQAPSTVGYTNFKQKSSSTVVGKNNAIVSGKNAGASKNNSSVSTVDSYKYARGSTKLVKTTRGYETDHSNTTALKAGKNARAANGPTGYDRYKSRKEVTSSSYKSNVTSRGANTSNGAYLKRSDGSNAARSTGDYRSKRSVIDSPNRSTVKSSSGSNSNSGAYRSKRTTNQGTGAIKPSTGGSKSSSGTIKRSSGNTKSSGSYRKSSGASSKPAPKSSGTVKSSSSKSSSGASKSSSGSKSSGGSKSKGKSDK